MSHGRRDMLLDLINGHFLDQIANRVKPAKTFHGTGDNYDLRIQGTHEERIAKR